MSRCCRCECHTGVSPNSRCRHDKTGEIHRYLSDLIFFTHSKIKCIFTYSFLAEIRPPKMKLECLAQYTLHGNIMSMQAVHLIGSQRDSLLLSFRDAKLSVVEYDQDIHDLRTVSLHYFEEEEIKVAISIGMG